MEPLTATLSYSALAGGAGGAGTAAAMSNPFTAAALAAAMAAAYGFSPTVREKTNEFVKNTGKQALNKFQALPGGVAFDGLPGGGEVPNHANPLQNLLKNMNQKKQQDSQGIQSMAPFTPRPAPLEMRPQTPYIAPQYQIDPIESLLAQQQRRGYY